jgi:hypothetical protein
VRVPEGVFALSAIVKYWSLKINKHDKGRNRMLRDGARLKPEEERAR